MPMDEVLRGIEPVNSPRRNIPLTKKEQAKAKHQSPPKTTAGQTVDSFGLGTVEEEVIEKQILRGQGRFHPSNSKHQSLDELKEEAELLKKTLGPKPGAITPMVVLGDRPPTPFNMYREVGGTVNESGIMNTVELGDQFVSIDTLAATIVRKIGEGQNFHSMRAKGYIAYFEWLVTCLKESLEKGEQFSSDIDDWKTKKEIAEHVHQMYEEQRAYTNSLTSAHLVAISQQEQLEALKESFPEQSKPKRKRRTNLELEVARAEEAKKNG